MARAILLPGDREICMCCGDIDPPRQTVHGEHDVHIVHEEDHHPECLGGECEQCPMIYERLCGPLRVLGHGGKLRTSGEMFANSVQAR